VLGRLIEDKATRRSSAAAARKQAPPPAARELARTAAAPAAPASAPQSRLGGASDMIEVLLPSGDEALGFEAPSDADSEEFIEYMQARQARKPPSRAEPTKAAAKPSSRGRGAAGRRR